ncbi:MAG: hypothetical protein JST50_02690 [Bacteroidetes bacterium]|nr:hypothetical protein [Bacteroidota bacterium]
MTYYFIQKGLQLFYSIKQVSLRHNRIFKLKKMSIASPKSLNIIAKFSRTQLYNLVWTSPLSTVAETHSITIYQLKQICNDNTIPLPRTGYWMKLRFGKAEPRTPLPERRDGDNLILPKEEEIQSRTEDSDEQKLAKEISETPGISLRVPAHLTQPEPLIIAAERSLNQQDEYRNQGIMKSTWDTNLDIKVTQGNISRALRIMDTLLKYFKFKGYNVQFRGRFTYVTIRKVELRINLREITKKVSTGKTWPEYDFVPTGILAFHFDGYHRADWKDNKKFRLEDQLLKIVTKLELVVKELHDCWDQNRKAQEAREAEEQAIRNEAERKAQELCAFKNLLGDARRWRDAQMIRDYLVAVSNYKDDEEWLLWANDKADWYDPLINKNDQLLKDVDKNLLIIPSKS